ncbi:MAG: AEC family transporter [Candidatus Heimdallarchaeota archaeon]|nr:MAG: AEC family transporter [Candidatus Heimdallarchaeota archaeon]
MAFFDTLTQVLSVLIEGLLGLLTDLLIVYIMIIIGIIWRFSRYYKPKYGKWINTITIWFFFPVNIISSFASIESFAGEMIIIVTVVAVIVHIASFLSIHLISRSKPPEEVGARVLCSTFPNSLLYPFPIILAILGSSALIYASIFVFVAMILRNSLGVLLGVMYTPEHVNTDESKPNSPFTDIKKISINLLKFPPLLAVIAGFILHAIVGPSAIGDLFALPGLSIVKPISLYGALILVGVSFRDIEQLHPRSLFSKEVFRVSSVRFLIAPLVVLVMLIILQVREPAVAITLIIQGMAPPAVINIMYGKFFNLKEDEISLLITSLTLLALIILPFELLILLVLFPIT